MRNIPVAEVLRLEDLVAHQDGQVVSRTLAHDGNTSVTLFAFAPGEGLSAHTAAADALAYVLSGAAVVEIDGASSTVRAGEAIVMPADKPHAVTAHEAFKMLLIIAR
jgi:quercetin dioxygenase-like cupin family protein